MALNRKQILGEVSCRLELLASEDVGNCSLQAEAGGPLVRDAEMGNSYVGQGFD